MPFYLMFYIREFRKLFVLFILICATSCSFKEDQLFQLLDSSKTGLEFINQININDSLNAVTFEYIYNGGGAAVGDVNNDGMEDLFFAGNMVSSRLYLNQRKLKFQDITDLSGVSTNSWCTGVSMVDINNDGLLDIYICVAGMVNSEKRKNIFFINQGIDENGIPSFVDMAAEMGLDDIGYSTMSVFFDFDKDQDLDMYLLTYFMDGMSRNQVRPIHKNGESANTDRLYRNDGDGTFSNASREAGILVEGYGLGVALCDINQDNWTDVYCANDFISNDLLWINNQDGTFTESAGKYFKHMSNNGMGMDVADYNNDGLLDVTVLDMRPVTNVRQKSMFSFRNMDGLNKSTEMGYMPQFVRNTLQLNMGKFRDGAFQFSEIGMLAGMHETDWSWAALFADFDNDGWKDLLITNGFRKDITDLDFLETLNRQNTFGTKETKHMNQVNAMAALPDVKLSNYAFQNKGDLTFEDKSKDWGLDEPTFSNGTIIADLDHDGDLDIVLNNIDQEVHLYENLWNKQESFSDSSHYLTIKFDARLKGSEIIGTKFWVHQLGNNQYFEYSPYRGYKSTVSPNIHIGLGRNQEIDSLIIQWNDGYVQKEKIVNTDTTYVISKSNSSKLYQGSYITEFDQECGNLFFKDITDLIRMNVKHQEVQLNDLQRTPTLIKHLSKFGPSLSVGDIDQDGLDDLFIGADKNIPFSIYRQNNDHTFSRIDVAGDSLYEDMGSLFFDADDDGDLDLYVVSGGSAWNNNDSAYQDQLYMNHHGELQLNLEALPPINSSGSCVIAADFDNDGDLDLFVGGRLVPGNYPSTPQSYLLENENGIFKDVSEKLGADNGHLGMVTSALWTDVNMDRSPDLLVVGEWMKITVLINNSGSFIDQSDEYLLTNTSGWWNSINGGDFDNDGDTDYLAGNFGLNSIYKASIEQPLEIHAKDFDRNGMIDPIITQYIDGEAYIIHTRNTLMNLIPGVEYRFSTYASYGNTPFHNAFSEEELKGAIHLDCKMMQSILLENVDGREFKVHDLPNEAQFSPIFGSVLEDFNNDNRLDMMLVGNSKEPDRMAGYYDASFGNIVLNVGDFSWNVLGPSNTNFIADGDKRAIVKLEVNKEPVYLISENDRYLKAIKQTEREVSGLKLTDKDWYYFIEGRKVELYHGSGFLSSSTRTQFLPKKINQINVTDFSGKQRIVSLDE